MVDKEFAKKKLEELQQEYSKTNYNKATNKHLGILRAKMAKLRKDILTRSSKKGIGYYVKKTGDATVALVGFPNAGKSSLLGALTGVESKVADYAFTTLEVIPGMLNYNGAKIQVLDLPGLIQGAHIGKGEGLKIISAIRVVDLMLFIVDVNYPNQLYQLLDEFKPLNIRINKEKPHIVVEEKRTGGIKVISNNHKIPDPLLVTGIINEYKIFNADIIFHQNATEDDIMDLMSQNTAYISGVVALNKIDTVNEQKVKALKAEIEKNTQMKVIPISAAQKKNMPELRDLIFGNLHLVRIYLKPKDGEPDLKAPLIFSQTTTVMDVARKINSKTAENAKLAYVTGKSAKFRNQKVGVEHKLKDEDIVTIIYDKA